MSTRSIGNIGEDIACKYIEARGFVVIERNYLKKWGEIDIIAHQDVAREKPNMAQNGQKHLITHFFEVKSITGYVASSKTNSFRPEDNVHSLKARHIARMIETYVHERGIDSDVEFQFHILCVYINMKGRSARVKWLKNIIL